MSYDGNENFAEWQTRARAKLSELLGMDRINPPKEDGFKIEYVEETEKYTDTRFVINGEEGYAFPLVHELARIDTNHIFISTDLANLHGFFLVCIFLVCCIWLFVEPVGHIQLFLCHVLRI